MLIISNLKKKQDKNKEIKKMIFMKKKIKKIKKNENLKIKLLNFN